MFPLLTHNKGQQIHNRQIRNLLSPKNNWKKISFDLCKFFFSWRKQRPNWGWAEAGLGVCLFVCFFSVISVFVLWPQEDTSYGTPVKEQLVEVASSWHGQYPQDRTQIAGFGGRCPFLSEPPSSPCFLIRYPGTMSCNTCREMYLNTKTELTLTQSNWNFRYTRESFNQFSKNENTYFCVFPPISEPRTPVNYLLLRASNQGLGSFWRSLREFLVGWQIHRTVHGIHRYYQRCDFRPARTFSEKGRGSLPVWSSLLGLLELPDYVIKILHLL